MIGAATPSVRALAKRFRVVVAQGISRLLGATHNRKLPDNSASPAGPSIGGAPSKPIPG
ncbi:uncharacterized protein sS8_5555 [Methylocaldum marinum]|uniref:Uncharacterized protein n=1 Tax=Methylocaldum marinum TaxID=1432792 RepID=A0A286P499_9GAMM|nr:uncharacterized protein sS8_5555 [Methylocaldum marinum]